MKFDLSKSLGCAWEDLLKSFTENYLPLYISVSGEYVTVYYSLL